MIDTIDLEPMSLVEGSDSGRHPVAMLIAIVLVATLGLSVIAMIASPTPHPPDFAATFAAVRPPVRTVPLYRKTFDRVPELPLPAIKVPPPKIVTVEPVQAAAPDPAPVDPVQVQAAPALDPAPVEEEPRRRRHAVARASAGDDLCARHGLHRVDIGRSWRCRR